jgi:hypothetical protein
MSKSLLGRFRLTWGSLVSRRDWGVCLSLMVFGLALFGPEQGLAIIEQEAP